MFIFIVEEATAYFMKESCGDTIYEQKLKVDSWDNFCHHSYQVIKYSFLITVSDGYVYKMGSRLITMQF